MPLPAFRTTSTAVLVVAFAALTALVLIAEREKADEYTEGEVDITQTGFAPCSLLTPDQAIHLGFDMKQPTLPTQQDSMCLWAKENGTRRDFLAVVLHPNTGMDYCAGLVTGDPEPVPLHGFPAVIGSDGACVSPAPDQTIEITMWGGTGLFPAEEVTETVASNLAEQASPEGP